MRRSMIGCCLVFAAALFTAGCGQRAEDTVVPTPAETQDTQQEQVVDEDLGAAPEGEN